MMASPARYIINHDATTGLWYVVDRLARRVVYFGTTVLSAGDRARDDEAAWRVRCQRWIEAEWRGALL